MKASKARSVAVEAQLAKITKKIENACKDGREFYEYKDGLLFDEVVKKLIEDGFLVIRNYVNNSAIISWVSEVDEETELDNVLRCIVPNFDEDGNTSDDMVHELDFYAPLDEIPTLEMIEEYLDVLFGLEGECCCICNGEACDDEDCDDEACDCEDCDDEDCDDEDCDDEDCDDEACNCEDCDDEKVEELEEAFEAFCEAATSDAENTVATEVEFAESEGSEVENVPAVVPVLDSTDENVTESESEKE